MPGCYNYSSWSLFRGGYLQEFHCIQNFLGQILRGVDAIHENRIVHRDLKPQNILVSRDATQIKIADFGLSRHIGSNAVLSTQVCFIDI